MTVLGDYVIPVTADPALYLPTYYEQTFLWEEADTLFFRNVSLDADMAMTQIPGDLDPSDVGLIFGFLEIEVDDEDDGSRVDGRRHQKGTRCHVRRRNTGGREYDDHETYTLIASVETDENGEFAIINLPTGFYRINFEYPGVPMDNDSFTEFEIGEDGSNSDVQLGALITEDGSIVVEQILPVGVDDKLFTDLKVYPNPVSNQLNVAYSNLKSSKVKVQLMDINGKVIIDSNLPRSVNHIHQIDVSLLDDGLYFLNMIDTSTGKLVKTFKLLLKK